MQQVVREIDVTAQTSAPEVTAPVGLVCLALLNFSNR
jgi:hypothetical protein